MQEDSKIFLKLISGNIKADLVNKLQTKNNKQENFYRRNLPHYYQPASCYFITFRLAGSLPIKKVSKLKEEYKFSVRLIRKNSKNKKELEEKLSDSWKRYFEKIDKLLHEYKKIPKYLENQEIASLVSSVLKFYNENEYDLLCYCIMPNHVHIIFTLKEKSRVLSKIMKSIKGYSARESNKILGRRGTFWQDESYDHIIRDEKELERIVYYVLNNPVKAGLVDEWGNWEWNYLCKINL